MLRIIVIGNIITLIAEIANYITLAKEKNNRFLTLSLSTKKLRTSTRRLENRLISAITNSKNKDC